MSPPSTTDSLRASELHVARYRNGSRRLPEQIADESAGAPDPFDRRERFAAYIAHELRTPIALQLALAEAALADPNPDARAWRAMSEGIIASCGQQQRLIEALLDLTRGQRGVTHQEPVNIAAITRRALQAHELSELDRVVALEPAFATGDPTLLERLAGNLVSNAIRHNIPHGRIEVATRTDAGRALLSIANTGPIIPAGDLARLFQPFERLAAQPQSRAEGTGLGLTIVQSVADAHDATVIAHAPASGGLQIEVTFPRPAIGNGTEVQSPVFRQPATVGVGGHSSGSQEASTM